MWPALLLASALLPLARSHSFVTHITVDAQDIQTWQPFSDGSTNASRITRAFADDKPITDMSSPDLACNVRTDGSPSANFPAPIHATITAGDELTFHWYNYPIGHSGPVLSYLAHCPSDQCEAWVLKGGEPVWFLINQGGWDGTNFASDTIGKTQQWGGVRIPPSLKAGAYLLRHEAFALHLAETLGAAQSFVACHQFEITGPGSEMPDTGFLVGFPGAYKADDPGLHLNIHDAMTKYTVPGPPVWPGGQTNAAPQASKAAGTTSNSLTPATYSVANSEGPASAATFRENTAEGGSVTTENVSPTVYTTITPSPSANPSISASGGLPLSSTSSALLLAILVVTWVQ